MIDDFFTNLLAELSANILSAGGRKAKQAITADDHQQAFQRCVNAGLQPLRDRIAQLPTDRRERALKVLRSLFNNEDLAPELAQVLRAQPPDPETLRLILVESKYDPDDLGTDWPDALNHFQESFLHQASGEPVLQSFIQTATLADIRDFNQEQTDLLRSIDQSAGKPQVPHLKARDITAKDVVVGTKNTTNNHYGAAPDKTVDLESAYLRAVYQKAAKLPLESIVKNEMEGSEAELTLDGVFTGLLTTSTAMVEQAEKPDHSKIIAVSPLHLLSKRKRLVLLGDPGSGKSSFVNFLALCLAGERLGAEANLERLRQPIPKNKKSEDEAGHLNEWALGDLVPVRVVLREFAAECLADQAAEDASVLADYIRSTINKAVVDNSSDNSYGDRILDLLREKDKALLMLDGLDEVANSEQVRGTLVKIIDAFATAYNCPILITCRIYAWNNQQWRFNRQDFADATLAEFTPAQIKAFVEGWYVSVSGKRDIPDKSADLNQAIRDRPEIAKLARSPLLLTLMAALHAWSGVGLPSKRHRLYAETVDLLLYRWLKTTPGTKKDKHLLAYENMDDKEFRHALAEVAFNAHARQEPGEDRAADLEKNELVSMFTDLCPDHNAGKMLDLLADKTGILIDLGEGKYSFPHRTFQEYFAAYHLAANQPERLKTLLPPDPDRWREVTLLTAAGSHGDYPALFWDFLRKVPPRHGSENHERVPELATGAEKKEPFPRKRVRRVPTG